MWEYHLNGHYQANALTLDVLLNLILDESRNILKTDLITIMWVWI